jgi:Flp pilus assembly protein TadD
MKKYTQAFVLGLVVTASSGCAHLLPSSMSQQDVAGQQADADAARALQSGNYLDALGLYRERVVDAPKDKAALLGLGESCLGLGQPEAALAAFGQVLALEKASPEALEGSGLAWLGLHQEDKAAEILQQVPPRHWRALNALGLIADMKGRYKDAEAWYGKALQASNSEAAIYNNYGYSRIMAHDFDKAETLLNRALELSPNNSRIRNNLMQAVAWQGKYEVAVGMRGDIPRYVALNNVGYIAWLRGEDVAAARMFQDAIDSDPTWYSLAAANLDRLKQSQTVQ